MKAPLTVDSFMATLKSAVTVAVMGTFSAPSAGDTVTAMAGGPDLVQAASTSSRTSGPKSLFNMHFLLGTAGRRRVLNRAKPNLCKLSDE